MFEHYLGRFFGKPQNIVGLAQELATSPGFDSMLHSVYDLGHEDAAKEHLMKTYKVTDEEAEKIFKEAEKIYYQMLKKMSKEERIDYRIKCNQR